jgi:hypothetical protein
VVEVEETKGYSNINRKQCKLDLEQDQIVVRGSTKPLRDERMF